MKLKGLLGVLFVAIAAAALTGCAKQDGSAILGRWHAERLDLMGLKLPVGPDLMISADKLSTRDMEWPITAIEQKGDEIVLDTSGGIGLTFHVVDADRIYVQIPFLDKVYYRRVKAAAPPALPVAPSEPRTVTPSVAAPAPAYAHAYSAAVQAARQGQRDAALRYLHQAAQQGFNGLALLESEAGFADLRSDPRYQVIVQQMPKP